MGISWNEKEGCIIRQRREEDEEEIEIDKTKEDSLTIAEQNRELVKDDKSLEEKCKTNKLDLQPAMSSMEAFKEKGKIKLSNDHSEEDVNPPLSICNGCNSEFEDGLSVIAFGALWHPQCLCCLHCHKLIAMDERKFHRPCYKEHCRPNCYVCKKKIPSTEEGIKYHKHPFWEDKYCPSHEDDGTAKCCSCERLKACGTEYVMLGDNRWLCIECKECAVMDTIECQPLYLEIRDFFKGLDMKVEKEIPLLLVEKQALNKDEEEKNNGVITRGICLSKEKMVTRVPNEPRPNQQLIGMTTESQRVVPECEVTAILILNGLPRLLTGYILAHEMMHAYLRLKGYRNLNMALEEGICQVLGHMWLESQRCTNTNAASSAPSSSQILPTSTTSKKGDQSDFEKELVEFCINQIETDESPVYGDGFKKVNEMLVLNHYNLTDTLKDIAIASKTLVTLPSSKF